MTTIYRRHGERVIRWQNLTCSACGESWQRPPMPGPKPRVCDECRRKRNEARQAGYARKRKDERLAALPFYRRWSIVGPMPCQGCRLLVYFGETTDDTLRMTREMDGWPHQCAKRASMTTTGSLQ